MTTYRLGQLAEALSIHMDKPPIASAVLPKDEADDLEAELHMLFETAARRHPDTNPMPIACAIAQAAYVLGHKHGMESAFRAADALAHLDPGDFHA